MRGRVIFVGTVREAVPALGVLLDSGVEIAEVVTLPAERAGSTSGFVDLERPARARGIEVRRCADINSADSVRHVRALQPDLVYTHFPEDVNADHGLMARYAWTACRPYGRPQVGKFAVFEMPSSMRWAWPMPGTELRPRLFADVTDTLETKIAAMECYETELRDYPHPRSSRTLRERTAYWGSHVGRPAAEPFAVRREVT